MSYEITPEVKKLHAEAIVIDGHCDTLLGVRSGEYKLGAGQSEKRPHHIDLPRMKEGGITTQVFACFTREQFLPAGATHESLRVFDAFYRTLEENSQDFVQVTRAADIERIKKEGKTGGMLSLEGVEPLEGDLSVLRMLYRLGLRQVGLTWNWRNQAADGLYEARSGGGLTTFGVDFVKEANRLGIILDVAHLSPAGIRDVMALTEHPIVDSHCGATGATEHVRNLDDGQLEAMAKNGGVVCVTMVPYFINADPQKASIEDMLIHIDYIVKKIGIDHVGLGSDFDGFDEDLPGLSNPSEMPQLTAGLLKRGYKAEDIKKILGGNYLRVIRKVVG